MRIVKRKTEPDLLAELKAKTDRKFGLTLAAEEYGFTIQFIRDVVTKRRPISPRLAASMGYRRVIEFERVRKAQ